MSRAEWLIGCIGMVACVCVLYLAALLLVLHVGQAAGTSPESFIVGSSGSDSEGYVALGKTMLSDGRFAMSPESATEFFRTPGYPVFVAVVLAIFGSPISIALAQILLVALSACLIYLLGLRFFSRGAGIAGAALYALDPTVMLKAFTAYTETLFVFVLLCASFLLIDERLTLRRAFAGGLFLGSLALVRPVGLFVVPVFFLWILWMYRSKLRDAAKYAAVCALGACLVVVPWMARNEALAGHFSLSSIGAYNTLFANVAEFEVFETGRSKEAVWEDMYARLGTHDSYAVHSYALHGAEVALIREDLHGHILAYAFFHAFKTLPFFFGSSIDAVRLGLYQQGILTGQAPPQPNISSAILSRNFATLRRAITEDPLRIGEQVLWLLVWGLAFLSIFLARGRERQVAVFFWVLALAFAALTGPISMPPYRLPAEPYIFLLAALCAGQLYHRFVKGRTPSAS